MELVGIGGWDKVYIELGYLLAKERSWLHRDGWGIELTKIEDCMGLSKLVAGEQADQRREVRPATSNQQPATRNPEDRGMASGMGKTGKDVVIILSQKVEISYSRFGT